LSKTGERQRGEGREEKERGEERVEGREKRSGKII